MCIKQAQCSTQIFCNNLIRLRKVCMNFVKNIKYFSQLSALINYHNYCSGSEKIEYIYFFDSESEMVFEVTITRLSCSSAAFASFSISAAS